MTGGESLEQERIERDIDRVRTNLVRTIGELDRRRHALFDVRQQFRRHPAPVVLAAAALVALVAGGIALGVTRHRRKEQIGSRLLRLREALRRMEANPHRVATDPGVGRRIAATAGGAVATIAVKRLAAKLFHDKKAK